MSKVYDIVIYGATSAGVIASVQAARLGKSVLLLHYGKHVGGMTSNGLGWVDVKDPNVIGGITLEYFQRVFSHYHDPSSWKYEDKHDMKQQADVASSSNAMFLVEPSVAEIIFNNLLDEHKDKITRLFQEFPESVSMTSGRITKLFLRSGKMFTGKVFIDCSYEGDLMSIAGISHTIGRESSSKYNEPHNGFLPDSCKRLKLEISPYRIDGNKSSGLLDRVSNVAGMTKGQGDHRVESFAYRLCLTNDPRNRVMITKPQQYSEDNYEIFFRLCNAKTVTMDDIFTVDFLPNRKIDGNNCGLESLDYIGMSWTYVQSDLQDRLRIAKAHEMWQRGFLYTLQNSDKVPEYVRNLVAEWGLAKDEFPDNNNWPYELYVREGRRMVSDFVITENTVMSKDPQEVYERSIGLAFYNMDSHCVQYITDPETGFLETDGGMWQTVPSPFHVSYNAICPPKTQCQNLLVPVCLSATHAAYGALRVEPTFMILAQSATLAACLSIDENCAVQDIVYDQLREKLVETNQKLTIPTFWQHHLEQYVKAHM